ncbi:TIGR02302 family protein [Rhodomicrobium sp. Az07]|uniref:TIGR02302 family protein n=1 Tax=Rhodomicrobium sp. Az07 TaxID=2839034 RepID=UPI001BEAFA1F|nr:TIGR02302 family protein [Rhodomicrobium sp. Az07]MBT3071506.1 TIGR02302 family protein [Rhodomicrobium sp. Az07]
MTTQGSKSENEAGAGIGIEASPSAEERLLRRKVRAARRAMLFEKLWPRVWLPLAVAGVFVLLSAFEVWQMLPPVAHFGLLWGFGAGFVLSLVPLVFWRPPSRQDALDRIERASALDHRPLTAFEDTLSQDAPPATRALWEAHQARAARSLTKLKTGEARPRVDRYDPFALRALLVLLLVGALASTQENLPNRIRAAFTVPDLPLIGNGLRIDAWISPPAYTRKEPFVLTATASATDAVPVPQGSTLTVKINGSDAKGYSVALASPGGGKQPVTPTAQSTDTYAEYTSAIDEDVTLSIGWTLGSERSWRLSVVPDSAPRIAFHGPIEVSPRAVMLLKYKVDDDYGVANAEARVERVIIPSVGERDSEAVEGPPPSLPQIGKPPVFPLSLPHAPVKAAEAKTYKDLTSHPWAGLPVVITLAAKDEVGREGLSAPRGMILPERKFTKTLARGTIDQRRSLVQNPADTARVADNLDALAAAAQDEGASAPIYLGLRSTFWRLKNNPDIADIEDVVGQLWDVAIRIEDGNLSAAERELRAAQERLKDAIERGASREEIQKLMAELRQALNSYLQALRQQQNKNADRAAASPNAKTISPQDLARLLDRIENLAKSGSADAAAQMLNQLRDILESLQTAQGSGQSQEEDAESLQKLDEMTDLLRKQQQLLDDTFRQQQNQDENGDDEKSAQPQQGQKQGRGTPKSSAELDQRQEDLLQQLQELLSGMNADGKDPVQQKLREAEEAMGDAVGSLRQKQFGEAGEDEGRAVESLRQGARALAEQMMRSAGGTGAGNQANRDPLGRKQNGPLDNSGDDVKIPDESSGQRARAIMDELRKRLGEPTRPMLELDYLERLIKPY